MTIDDPPPPQFADDVDQQCHEGLIERGYRYFGWNNLKRSWLYQRRFQDKERDVANPHQCCVDIWRYDLRSSNGPVGYEVEIYFEVKPWQFTTGHVGILHLYGFPTGELLAKLGLLEKQCLLVWALFSRKEGKDVSP